MNNFFIDDLIERFETVTDSVHICEQSDVLDYINDFDYRKGCNYFPMICFEETNDSPIKVLPAESKFLTDPEHRGTWMIGMEGDAINYIMCLKSQGDTLYIDTFEVNKELRGQGVAGNVISVIESVAELYFKYLLASPFDTDAISFWEHMDYVEGKNGYWAKIL